MKHNEPFEDDGRTVADMSGIEHDSIWLPRRRKQGHTPAQQPHIWPSGRADHFPSPPRQ